MHGLTWGPSDRPVDVVFLHANGFNALTYRSILAPLGEGLRIVALDQRGHGRTRLPTVTEGRPDWLDLRDDLLAALEEMNVENAILAGHSMGGTVSILAASAEPRRARSLVVFDPVIMQRPSGDEVSSSPMVEAARRRRADFDSADQTFASYKGRGAFKTWPDTMLADYLEDGLRERVEGGVTLACTPAWEASGFAAHGHDLLAAIASLDRPLRILKAETNSTCRVEPGAVAPAACMDIEILPGTTHFLPMERPDQVREALRSAAKR